jgi:hypothetical protein
MFEIFWVSEFSHSCEVLGRARNILRLTHFAFYAQLLEVKPYFFCWHTALAPACMVAWSLD